MRKLLIAVALLLASEAHAADRADKMRALMEAQGLAATFDQQMQAGREQVRANARQMLDQLMAGLKPDPTYQQKFRLAADAYIEELQAPWSAQQVVDVWAGIYGAQFTDAELDKLLAWYTSPLAQKEVTVTRASLLQFSAHFQEQYKPIMERATAAYVQKLKALAAECNCQRK